MTLDPVLSALLGSAPKVTPPVDWEAVRQSANVLLPLILGNGPRDEVASVEERQITGPGGSVGLRIYRPSKPSSITLHYIHGGGWTVGDLEMVDHTMRYICESFPAVVVSSTYRLAPEHPFPAAFEDTLAAARWTIEHVAELGGNSQQVAIAGDSAGGNLAAAVTIALRDANISATHPFKAQLLLYPAVDLRPSAWTLPSRIADADPSLTCDGIRATVEPYIRGSDPNDWRLSPLAADDLSRLPAAMVVVLTVDPLRDEGVAYAERLQREGGAELVEFSNMTHGFTHLRRIVPAAATASDEVLVRFRALMDND